MPEGPEAEGDEHVTEPLSLLWLLEESSISGTVRAVCAYADGMVARGHAVAIATTGEPPYWRRSRAEWSCVERFDDLAPGASAVVIATSWRTIAPASRLAGSRAFHLCLRDESAAAGPGPREQVEAAYAISMPRITLSPHVASALSRFGGTVELLPPIVDEEFYRPAPAGREPSRVLLCGSSEDPAHGVEYGYGAIAHARWFHQEFDLVRVSAWAPSREEPLDSVQEFHVALTAAEMTRLMHSCDVLVAPNLRGEGFSFPAAEAMASGIPAVMSDVPALAGIGGARDYALFAPEGNAVELGERLIEILTDAGLRERVARRARQVAARWHPAEVIPALEAILSAPRAS